MGWVEVFFIGAGEAEGGAEVHGVVWVMSSTSLLG